MSDRFDHTLDHTFERKGDEPGDAGLVRRIELITGSGRRRRWSTDDKARIVLESLAPGANVSEVARRHGLRPQQLFGWRRQAHALMSASAIEAGASSPVPAARERARRTRDTREKARRARPCERLAASEPVFAPVVVAAPVSPQAPPTSPADMTSAGRIEIVIGDAIVRVGGEVEASLLTAVLCAVRRMP
jgi:transposase